MQVRRIAALLVAAASGVIVLGAPGVSGAAANPGACPGGESGYRLEAANNPFRVALDKNGDGFVCVKDLNENAPSPRNLIDNNVQGG